MSEVSGVTGIDVEVMGCDFRLLTPDSSLRKEGRSWILKRKNLEDRGRTIAAGCAAR